MVLTSDKSPVEMQGLEERMITRMKWGMTVELLKPDLELRKKILNYIIKQEGLILPNEIIDFITKKATDNVRDLEGIVTSLVAHSLVYDTEIDIELTSKVVGKIVKSSLKTIYPEMIINTVSKYYNVEINDILSKSRKREIVKARQITMFLYKKHTKYSFAHIGSLVGQRDHVTVLHACRTVQDLIDIDKAFRYEITEIGEYLVNGKFDSYNEIITEEIEQIEENYKINETNSYLIKEIIICLLEKDFVKASILLKKDYYGNLLKEVFFLQKVKNFDGNESVLSNIIYIKAKLWQLMSKHFFLYTTEKTLSIENQYEKSENNVISTNTIFQNSQEKGAALENLTVELFKELFEMNEIAEKEILEKVRKQDSGYQFGFDIEVHYLTKNKKLIKCKIECKNYNEKVRYKDISEKIDTLRYSTHFEHFIIISPNSNPDNKLNNAIANWNADPTIKFFIQIWSPNTFVQDFFGLKPNIFNHFYRVDDINHPQNWTKEKRKEVILEFKNKLKPRINLSPEWKKYIENSDEKLLLKKDDRNEYLNLYKNFIDLKALDINGDTLDNSLFSRPLRIL